MAVEALLRYSSGLAASFALSAPGFHGQIRSDLAALSKPSLGHWVTLLQRCHKAFKDSDYFDLTRGLFSRSKDLKTVEGAIEFMADASGMSHKKSKSGCSVMDFLETYVQFRNRAIAHGSTKHGVVDLVGLKFDNAWMEILDIAVCLQRIELVFVAEIEVTRLAREQRILPFTGISPVARVEITDSSDETLTPFVKTLVFRDRDNQLDAVLAEPFLKYLNDDIYAFDGASPGSKTDYLCLHSGDRIALEYSEQVKSLLVADLDDSRPESDKWLEIYRNAVSLALSVDESEASKAYLRSLAGSLGLSAEQVRAVESAEREKYVAGTSHSDSVLEAIDQQRELLRKCGEAIVRTLYTRPDRSKPVSADELLLLLRAEHPAVFAAIDVRRLITLIGDVRNHGLAPGLVKSENGYALFEAHIAFKVGQRLTLKEEVAAAAVNLIKPGHCIGLDGGSTTLPIARAIASAVEDELLTDLKIVTNSVPVVKVFAELIDRRGWMGDECPVEVMICGGKMRAITEAIADPTEGGGIAHTSLSQLVDVCNGLDISFVGCNGITLDQGITIPNQREIVIKQIFLDRSEAPYIVGDVSKIGLIHPHTLATWEDPVHLLTNRPAEAVDELDRILHMERRRLEIHFSDSQRT
jgi:DeoR/GlpR family transcriptional regulator of sugar metabolism